MREAFLLILGSLLYVSGLGVMQKNSVCLTYVSIVRENKDALWKGDLSSYNLFTSKLCRLFTGECEHFKKHVPYVIAMIGNDISAIDVCRFISSPSEAKIAFMGKSPKSFVCTGCKTVVDFIKFEINVLKKTSAQVKAGIEYLCKLLAPLKVQVEVCNDIVEYIDNIIQWILNGTTPGDVCEKLKLCNNETITDEDKSSTRKFRLVTFRNFKKFPYHRSVLSHRVFGLHPIGRRQHPFRPRHHPLRPRHHPFRPRHHPFRPWHHRFWPRHFRPHRRGHHGRHRHHSHRHHYGHHTHHNRTYSNLTHHRHHHHHWIQVNYTKERNSNISFPLFVRWFMNIAKISMGDNHENREKVEITDEDGEEKGTDVDGKYEEEEEDDYDEKNDEDDDETDTGDDTYESHGEHKDEYTKTDTSDGVDEEPIDSRETGNSSYPDQPAWVKDGENTDLIADNTEENFDYGPAYDEAIKPILPTVPTKPIAPDIDFDLRESVGKSILRGFLGNEYFPSGKKIEKKIKSAMKKTKIPDFGMTEFKHLKFPGLDLDDDDDKMKKEMGLDKIREKVGGDILKMAGFDIDKMRQEMGLNKLKIPELDFDKMRKEILKDPMMKGFVKKIGKGFKRFGKKFEKIAKKIEKAMTKRFGNGTGLFKNGIGCTICKTIVTFITWEVKTVNASLETVEKAVKAMCALYPIKIATEVCDEIVDKVDEVVQLVEEGVEPGDVCERLKLCNSTQQPSHFTSLFVSFSPPARDSSLCAFVKTVHETAGGGAMKLWTTAKGELVEFCQKNQIESKCNPLYRIFEKTERQLSDVITFNDTENGTCFKNQPKPPYHRNKCKVCNMFERGLVGGLKEMNDSMELLAITLDQMCSILDTPQCMDIVTKFRSAFQHFEQFKPGQMCKTIGFCNNKTEKKIIEAMVKKHVKKLMEKLLPENDGFGGW
ncbi:uncharacterized protein LOC130630194 [Hydractinia symbiolongicarpus]|uniref:uncharacterized protein LOC130630194 n=1 Tax=Hydractinia symbiolongicarpus TaxID=13093 RepID=UPI00254A7B66|nr:uncharacterized protein LOC130630194 [Hydractinia symbiolongicarpus]